MVLDDGMIGGGMTGRTTAHLSNAYDDRYVEIERLHGAEASRLTAESHTLNTLIVSRTDVQPYARTLPASWRGTQPRKPGIVHVTVRGLVRTERFIRDLLTAIWSLINKPSVSYVVKKHR